MSNLKELDEAATSGVWGQFNPTVGPWKDQAAQTYKEKGWVGMDSSHDMSALFLGKPYRLASFKHASDAAFAEALVNAYRRGEIVEKGKSDA